MARWSPSPFPRPEALWLEKRFLWLAGGFGAAKRGAFRAFFSISG